MRPFLLSIFVLFATAAAAHHVAEPRMRTVLITEEGGDTILYVRLPAPLVFAAALAAREKPEDRVDAPFLRPMAHRAGWAHYLDASQVADDPAGFARLAADAFAITVDGAPAAVEATDVAVHSLRALPPFATPAEARAALDAPALADDLFVGHGFVQARLAVRGTGDLVLRSTVDTIELPEDIFMENVIVDFRRDPPVDIGQLGAWEEAIVLDAP